MSYLFCTFLSGASVRGNHIGRDLRSLSPFVIARGETARGRVRGGGEMASRFG
jgi:hypothetical protein